MENDTYADARKALDLISQYECWSTGGGGPGGAPCPVHWEAVEEARNSLPERLEYALNELDRIKSDPMFRQRDRALEAMNRYKYSYESFKRDVKVLTRERDELAVEVQLLTAERDTAKADAQEAGERAQREYDCRIVASSDVENLRSRLSATTSELATQRECSARLQAEMDYLAQALKGTRKALQAYICLTRGAEEADEAAYTALVIAGLEMPF